MNFFDGKAYTVLLSEIRRLLSNEEFVEATLSGLSMWLLRAYPLLEVVVTDVELCPEYGFGERITVDVIREVYVSGNQSLPIPDTITFWDYHGQNREDISVVSGFEVGERYLAFFYDYEQSYDVSTLALIDENDVLVSKKFEYAVILRSYHGYTVDEFKQLVERIVAFAATFEREPKQVEYSTDDAIDMSAFTSIVDEHGRTVITSPLLERIEEVLTAKTRTAIPIAIYTTESHITDMIFTEASPSVILEYARRDDVISIYHNAEAEFYIEGFPNIGARLVRKMQEATSDDLIPVWIFRDIRISDEQADEFIANNRKAFDEYWAERLLEDPTLAIFESSNRKNAMRDFAVRGIIIPSNEAFLAAHIPPEREVLLAAVHTGTIVTYLTPAEILKVAGVEGVDLSYYDTSVVATHD